MKNQLLSLRDRLRSSYWFIPLVMNVLAFLLSILAVKLDERLGPQLSWVVGLVYVDSPEGAREVLSTIASSMITVAGVVFSLTMVVLSLTSQQYGPLVLSNFIRDRGNQFVLGTFTATFVYCLLVLRTIRGVGNSIFIPHISVLLGIGLSIASLAVLIYFIHHVSESIRATTIIARVTDDLREAVRSLYPAQLGLGRRGADDATPDRWLPENFRTQQLPLPSRGHGYLQFIDDEALMNAARDHDVIIELLHQPGNYLYEGASLARVWPLERLDARLIDRVQDAVALGETRTQVQDVGYLFNQLASIAVRAMSPAINDPYTASAVVVHLGEALGLLGNRQMPSIYRYDSEGKLRVVAQRRDFDDLLRLAFDEIWHYGHSDPRVNRQLHQTLRLMEECIDDEDKRRVIRRYAAEHPRLDSLATTVD